MNAHTDTETVEILPCPFCSSTDVRAEFDGWSGWVHCNTCQADGPMADSEEDGIDAWNKRGKTNE